MLEVQRAPLVPLDMPADAYLTDTPVIRLFGQWDAARKTSAAIDDEASAAALISEQIRLENELIRMPATCRAAARSRRAL
ncbi:hypothetical protein SAMN05421763_105313 [[Luteovulum] sphaeroides subsp. megalophilum]|nr:hypothetical protein SAMN05421763_105313 [[Luteovulum] sphaeroides subsp. megalophilum]